ncbi:uncharacterized protein F5147DRAFT_576621 [Suillus discolor]|uniref:Uncharacterized protein n=1 Tax=Suillus discolor TaxID=1912936 RepID=A0A9P7F7X0_9AGAM|nr:uncharacterized protein F5147DRAFT_576621 [Suillus discolor]KAG2108716.1 hypothetical protein F5147DRAFT_576621 [Suillus discolor]
MVAQVQNTPSGVKQGGDPQSALRDAKKAVKGMNLPSGPVESGASAAQNASGDLEDAYIFQDTYLQPLRIFDDIIGQLADVHPYAKIALGVLSCASKMVIAQSDRDQAVHRLVDKLDQVFGFMIQDETLSQISSMRGILGQISQQTLECARFIRDYSETKSFCESSSCCTFHMLRFPPITTGERLRKDILTETNNEIQRYSDALDALMQNFRDQVARDVAIYTHHTGEYRTCSRCNSYTFLFRRTTGPQWYNLCSERRARYQETMPPRDAHGSTLPDHRLGEQHWRRRSTGAVAIWPCRQGQISHRPHDC